MANNGYFVSGSCTGDVFLKFVSSCPSGTYNFYAGYLVSTNKQGGGTCYSSSGSPISNVSVPVFDCEISGQPFTDVQQIQAVNQILPYALAFLASIWAMKKVFQVLWNSSISFSSKKEQE